MAFIEFLSASGVATVINTKQIASIFQNDQRLENSVLEYTVRMTDGTTPVNLTKGEYEILFEYLEVTDLNRIASAIAVFKDSNRQSIA